MSGDARHKGQRNRRAALVKNTTKSKLAACQGMHNTTVSVINLTFLRGCKILKAQSDAVRRAHTAFTADFDERDYRIDERDYRIDAI